VKGYRGYSASFLNACAGDKFVFQYKENYYKTFRSISIGCIALCYGLIS
jgi:hypothetical protein